MVNEIKSKKHEGHWKDIIKVFVSDMLFHLNDNISRTAENWSRKIKSAAIGAFLGLIGMIFLLIALARLVDQFILTDYEWAGHLIIGIILIIVGYFFTKKRY